MDIDIDLAPRFEPEKLFKVTRASVVQDGELKPHLVGVYFQNIAIDPFTQLAAIPHKEAEELGYTKIDMLSLSLLEVFESKEEVRALLRRKPNWKLLEEREVVEKLFHLSKHFELVYELKPKSVLEIADILAMIRPGKMKLRNKYLKDKKAARVELYTKREKSDLRKSHAIPYAMLVVIQLNLIELGIL